MTLGFSGLLGTTQRSPLVPWLRSLGLVWLYCDRPGCFISPFRPNFDRFLAQWGFKKRPKYFH
ncbi:MAG: hypothetical protein ACFCBU_04450 [Cyanophyceae cyanobacterium]